MKRGGKKGKGRNPNKESDVEPGSDGEDIFTDEISEFTDARNKIDLDDDNGSESEEEEIFGLVDEDDESDEDIGEWSKRLKQIKFQTKLDKNKPISDAPEKSWGNKRQAYYGSGVRRKPKETTSDIEDEWTMEEKEIEKLQQKLDEGIDEDDFLMPLLSQKEKIAKENELMVKRDFSEQEKEEFKRQVHPEAEPLRQELNTCISQLEKLKGMKGWKAESRDTCFRLLAANIAFYLYLIENNIDCRGHPVLKRIVQWKKLSKMYEAVPVGYDDDSHEDNTEHAAGHKRNRRGTEDSVNEIQAKQARLALNDSDDDTNEDDGEEAEDNTEIGDGELENRPVTYEIEKNKPKVKTRPNNPRVKHRERFRKAKIRRRGKIREYKPELTKYQGEASGIRAGIVRSVRLH